MSTDTPDLVDELIAEIHDAEAELRAAASDEQAADTALALGVVGAMAAAEMAAGPVIGRLATAALPDIIGLRCPECEGMDCYRFTWPQDDFRYSSEIECMTCGRRGIFVDLVVVRS